MRMLVIMTQYRDQEIKNEAISVGAEKFLLKDNIMELKKLSHK